MMRWSVPKWNDFGNIWATLRELDVKAIRDESERPLAIACVGHAPPIDEIDRLLFTGAERYGAGGVNPIELIPIDQAAQRAASLRSVDMLILGVDTRVAITPAEAEAIGQLERFSLPALVVLVYGERTSGAALPRSIAAHTVVLADPLALDAADRLATAVLERLPAELHLTAARRLAGVRASFARDLINSTSFTNATYSLASGLPEQIPILSVPFAAADILVLTKNQAMMVYRLALAYGAPPDFQERIREVIPVVGGAFLWRQAARSLIGLIPVWGLLPKVAIAYAGTYTTGVAAWRWFASGEIVSTDQLKRISNEALQIGRARAAEIIDRARNIQGKGRALPAPALNTPPAPKQGIFARLKRLLPQRRPPVEPTAKK